MKEKPLDLYRSLLGSEIIDSLQEISSSLKNVKIVHVNSTKEGGGVAEILSEMIPLTEALGLNVQWEVIHGDPTFFQCTKLFHNLLQGQNGPAPSPPLLQSYEETTKKNGADLQTVLQNADFVFIHDPQPLALISTIPNRKGKWIWRCHIDLSSPSAAVWSYLKEFVDLYEGSIYSLKEFVPQHLSHPTYVIPPSIDPLSEKNRDLGIEEIEGIYAGFGIDLNRPTLLQVSRFDRFKDPLGVIEAYRLVKGKVPTLQLILAGSGADDDPESEEVLKEVRARAGNDPDLHILLLPPTAHRTINALQRGATIVLQKSVREGFGLTVSEALWKAKPVIGGNTGGIRLQIIEGETGFLVNSPEEAANRIEYLLQNPKVGQTCGENGKKRVTERFLITRHLKDYLTVMAEHLTPQIPL